MSVLLLHLIGDKVFNRTIFPPHLYVYDDLLVYKKRQLLFSREITISYNQISQITMTQGILFAGLEIVTTGKDDIKVRFVNKKQASQAKKIIDQKIFHSHAKHHDIDTDKKAATSAIEKSLSRLDELLGRGHIDEKEYDQRKNRLLNQL